MNIQFKEKFKIVIIILLSGLLLGGLFYFLSRKSTFVSENKEIFLDSEIIENIQNDSSNEPAANEEEVSQNNSSEKIVPNENNDSVKKDSVKENIIENPVSWGFTPSKERIIDTIILHSSYNALGGDEYDTEKIIDEYRQYGVAAHYLVDREGLIYRLVKDEDIAYHAGVSEVPDGRKNVNNFSIGIEIINTKEDKYTKEQYDATNYLIEILEEKYAIKYILGHDEIAPDRKTDPWNINWEKINR